MTHSERRAWARPALPVVLLLALVCMATAGCGEEGVTPTTVRKTIALKDLPDPVQKAAKKALPGVEFEDAWENREKGVTLQSYEIRGRNAKGKIREVRVSPAGEILEME